MENFYRLTFTFFIVLIISSSAFSQSRIFTGTMRDNNGEGLPGGTVIIKGTSEGTVTDIDGKYQISVEIGNILVLSFVGMDSHEIVITMSNSSPNRYYKAETPKPRRAENLPKPTRPKLSDFINDSAFVLTPTNKTNVKTLTTDSPRYRIFFRRQHRHLFRPVWWSAKYSIYSAF